MVDWEDLRQVLMGTKSMKRQAGIFIFLKKECATCPHPHDKLIQMYSHSFRFGENKTVISCGKILPSKLDLTGLSSVRTLHWRSFDSAFCSCYLF